MDHISIRVTDTAYLGDRSHSRDIEFSIDLKQPAPLQLRSSLEECAAAMDAMKAEPAKVVTITRPRFERLSHTFEVIYDAAIEHTYVRDNVHQLIWARTNRTATATGPGEAIRANHERATQLCEELGKGWRLPTRGELLTLVDDTRHEPATFEPFVADTESSWYWTSTPAAWSSSSAWCVGFDGGSAGSYRRSGECFVRAVRSVSAPPAGQ